MKNLRWLFLLLLVLQAGISASVAANVWTADDVPIPYLRDSTQYVSDPDRYVAPALRDSANLYLAKLNRECGVQNVLVIVGRVRGQDAFRMAQDLGNKYGIGYKGSRRGLVVVIVVEDRKYFIAPGMGLEGELTDVDCDDIARACIVKYMRENEPGQAVLAVSRALYNKVKSGRTGISSVDDNAADEDAWPLVALCLLLCFGVPVYMLVRYVLERMGLVKPRKRKPQPRRRRDDDDWMPPFFMGGGGFSSRSGGDGPSGGSFGGGSFGGGGSGGGW